MAERFDGLRETAFFMAVLGKQIARLVVAQAMLEGEGADVFG